MLDGSLEVSVIRWVKVIAPSAMFVLVVATSPRTFTQSICDPEYFVKKTECGRPDLAGDKLKECEAHFMGVMSMCNPAAERQWYYRSYYEENCEKAHACSPTCRVVREQLPKADKLGGKCD
jgi:hypothetical protein